MNKSNLKQFQELLIKNKIDLYIVPTSDFHHSEYVDDYFKCREFLSNFTGSAGTLVVTQNNAYIFVDGRYFVQVEKEVNKNEITIMKLGEKNVPSTIEFIINYLEDGQTIAFDGRVNDCKTINIIKNMLANKKITYLSNIDLVDEIWNNRPSLPILPLFRIDEYAGCNTQNKLTKIRNMMEDKGATTHIITSLDDIAYTLNLRGHDIPCNPVFLSYMLINKNEVILYINKEKLSKEISEYLKENNIIIKDYFALYEDIKAINNERILLDSTAVNYLIYSSICDSNEIIDDYNPAMLMKAVKNDIEINNLRQCHILDGLAMLDFMIFIKNIKNEKRIYTEYEIGELIDLLRAKQPYFIENSFNPIVAYKENAAMAHYSAKKKGSKKIQGNGLLLVDSGGQYYLGTTDITRTFVIGKINKEIKRHFTMVLKSMFNLSSAKFLKGCSGLSLDSLARTPLWNENLNYNHGTGHGVGYCLNVHEGPNSFRYKSIGGGKDSLPLEIGMTTSDEPGIYIENSHGIRHENVLLTVKDIDNEYGSFLRFETLTLCPFDLEGLDLKILTLEDKNRINEYHKHVYEKLSPYCDETQLKYLEKFTKNI